LFGSRFTLPSQEGAHHQRGLLCFITVKFSFSRRRTMANRHLSPAIWSSLEAA